MKKVLLSFALIGLLVLLGVVLVKSPMMKSLNPYAVLSKIRSLISQTYVKRSPSITEPQQSGTSSRSGEDTTGMRSSAPPGSAMNHRLGLAISQDDIDGIRAAITAGADVNCCADYGVGTPLMQATFKRQTNTVRFLLDSGAHVNAQSTQDGATVLHRLTFFCDTPEQISLATLLLDRGADVAIRDKHGKTPLDYAIQSDCKAMQDLLIAYAEKQGKTSIIADAKSRKLDAQTSLNLQLCRAASRGDLEGIKRTIKAGADINCPDFGAGTPLMQAAFARQVEAVRLLLDFGADVNQQTKLMSWTALRMVGQHCCGRDDEEWKQRALQTAELLLQRGADPCILDDSGYPAWAAPYLVPYICKDYCRSMRMLFLRYSEKRSPLTATSGRCSREGMNKNFLDFIYDFLLYPNMAPKKQDLEEIKAVLAAGGDENCCQDWERGTPLGDAAFLRSLRVAQLLLELGADVNGQSSKDGETPLHRALHGCAAWGVTAGHDEELAMVKLLLESGADLSIKDREGDTAVDKAFKNHCSLLQRLLLGHRDQQTTADESDKPPIKQTISTPRSAEAQRELNWKLAQAASSGKIAEMEDAIKGGADVSCCAEEGNGTPLMRAAFGRRLEAIRLLLDSGADVNRQATQDGRTALHTIVEAYSPYGPDGEQALAIAELLLQKGADVNIRNKNGKTPIEIATERNLKPMSRLLLSYR